ncbi:hypothetical protein ABIB80_007054 [Bradyrhizobium sp. i1.15.2]
MNAVDCSCRSQRLLWPFCLNPRASKATLIYLYSCPSPPSVLRPIAPAAILKRSASRPTASHQNSESIAYGLIEDNHADGQKKSERRKESSSRAGERRRVGTEAPFFRPLESYCVCNTAWQIDAHIETKSPVKHHQEDHPFISKQLGFHAHQSYAHVQAACGANHGQSSPFKDVCHLNDNGTAQPRCEGDVSVLRQLFLPSDKAHGSWDETSRPPPIEP